MIVHKPSRSDDAPRRIAEAEWGTVREAREAGQPPGRPREARAASREAVPASREAKIIDLPGGPGRLE